MIGLSQKALNELVPIIINQDDIFHIHNLASGCIIILSQKFFPEHFFLFRPWH